MKFILRIKELKNEVHRNWLTNAPRIVQNRKEKIDMSNSLKYKNKYTLILAAITGINLVLLMAMLLFCYRYVFIEDADIPGLCIECMEEHHMTGIRMILAMFINIIQIVLVVSMCIVLKAFKKNKGTCAFLVLSIMTMILSGINMLQFWGLRTMGHLETGAEMIKLDVQFMSARVISAIVICLNIVLLIFVEKWDKED